MNIKSLSHVIAFKQQNMSTIDINKGKRMDSYKKLYNFAYNCVVAYSKYDTIDGFYSLSLHCLPDFTKHEFASLIMSYCEDYASEATGPDNKDWHSKMLPALTRYLARSSDRDEEIEFTKIWRDCVTDYMTFKMDELISDALSDYNDEMGCPKDSFNYHGARAHGKL